MPLLCSTNKLIYFLLKIENCCIIFKNGFCFTFKKVCIVFDLNEQIEFNQDQFPLFNCMLRFIDRLFKLTDLRYELFSIFFRSLKYFDTSFFYQQKNMLIFFIWFFLVHLIKFYEDDDYDVIVLVCTNFSLKEFFKALFYFNL